VTQVPKGNWKVMAFYLDASFGAASKKNFEGRAHQGRAPRLSGRRRRGRFISLTTKSISTMSASSSKGDQVLILGRAGHASHRRAHVDSRFQQGFEKKYGYSP